MAQGDQAGAGGGGGKRKNKNRNRNRNRNKQANAANQQPTQPTEEAPAPVSVHSGIPKVSVPASSPDSAPLESNTVAAQHQLPIFDSSIGTFRPVTNTFLPSYATVNADSGVVDDGLPDVGNMSSSDDDPPKPTGKKKLAPAQPSDNNQGKAKDSKENAVEKEIAELELEAKKLENKKDDIERQNKLIGNLTMELQSRPDLGNWPAIRDAERNYVNTQIKRKNNKSGLNGVETSDDDFEHVGKWSQADEKELEKKKEILKDRNAELIKNLKMEMSSNPYLANWAQIMDAETRFSTNNSNTLGRTSKKEGNKKASKGNKNKVRQYLYYCRSNSKVKSLRIQLKHSLRNNFTKM